MAYAGDEDGHCNRGETIAYQSSPEENGEAELSTRVLMALDSLPGYNVENSETVIFDHVDLDALDELFTQTNGTLREGEVTFPVGDYRVTVTAAGGITICN